jgi:hypothetical protein
MAECNINAYGASFLASALAVNKSLQSIIMSNNAIGSSQSSKRIAFALMKNSNLKVLKMSSTGLGDGIEHFARLVETTKSLKSLDLSANSISDDGATALGNALTFNRSIRSLCLKRNKIGDSGIQVLAAALVSNTVLEVLDVGGNIIVRAALPPTREPSVFLLLLPDSSLSSARTGGQRHCEAGDGAEHARVHQGGGCERQQHRH